MKLTKANLRAIFADESLSAAARFILDKLIEGYVDYTVLAPLESFVAGVKSKLFEGLIPTIKWVRGEGTNFSGVLAMLGAKGYGNGIHNLGLAEAKRLVENIRDGNFRV